MGKSLFFRMISVYLLILIMAFSLVGGIFFETLKNDFLEAAMDTMIEDAKVINEWAAQNYHGEITDEEMGSLLVQKAIDDDTVIWLISSGIVYMIADPDKKGTIEETFSSESTREFFQLTQQGNCAKRVSNVDRSFKGTVMSVAIPLAIDEAIVGTIVVHKEVDDFGVGISSIFRKVFFPLLITVLFAFLLVFFLSRHIVRPIADISQAAGELSRGNLDFRVKRTTDDEIGELADSFNKMAEELKLQDGLRNSFIANVSHELRTPLASMQGFIQGMLDRAIDESDRDKYLEIVLSETKRMNSLISDLLILSKVESGKFPIELSAFDINELLRRCIIMFEQRIEEKHLDVDIRLSDERLIVWADEVRISQVIMNLIDNAVKFSHDGGMLKIWTGVDINKVYVSIADTGDGIPKEDQPYVFERFYKVDKSHSRRTPGTGIGLSIVKRIITQHGEAITLESEEGKGTTFMFTLTRAMENAEEKPRKNNAT